MKRVKYVNILIYSFGYISGYRFYKTTISVQYSLTKVDEVNRGKRQKSMKLKSLSLSQFEYLRLIIIDYLKVKCERRPRYTVLTIM